MMKESDALFSIYSPARTQSRENKGHFNVTVYVHMLYMVYFWVMMMMMMMKKSLFTKAHVCCEMMYVMPTRFLLYHDALLYGFYRLFGACGAHSHLFLSLCTIAPLCDSYIWHTHNTHPWNAAQRHLFSHTQRRQKNGRQTAGLRPKKKKLDNRVARSLHICMYIKLCVCVKCPMFLVWRNTVISALYCAAYLRRERAYKHLTDTTTSHNNKHVHRRAMRSLCPLSLGLTWPSHRKQYNVTKHYSMYIYLYIYIYIYNIIATTLYIYIYIY